MGTPPLNAKEPKTPLAINRNTFRGSFVVCKEYITIAANPSSVPTNKTGDEHEFYYVSYSVHF